MDSVGRLEYLLQPGTVYPVMFRDIYLGHAETQAAAIRHASRQMARWSSQRWRATLAPNNEGALTWWVSRQFITGKRRMRKP
jgi:hypothetical protein